MGAVGDGGVGGDRSFGMGEFVKVVGEEVDEPAGSQQENGDAKHYQPVDGPEAAGGFGDGESDEAATVVARGLMRWNIRVTGRASHCGGILREDGTDGKFWVYGES